MIHPPPLFSGIYYDVFLQLKHIYVHVLDDHRNDNTLGLLFKVYICVFYDFMTILL